jgi:hypothetical protein
VLPLTLRRRLATGDTAAATCPTDCGTVCELFIDDDEDEDDCVDDAAAGVTSITSLSCVVLSLDCDDDDDCWLAVVAVMIFTSLSCSSLLDAHPRGLSSNDVISSSANAFCGTACRTRNLPVSYDTVSNDCIDSGVPCRIGG